jgi:hypothetical protein
LAADWPVADSVGAKAYGVGLDVNGKIVKGAGVTGIKGVLLLTQSPDLRDSTGAVVGKWKAGDWVDVMTSGEFVQWATTAGVAGVPGFNYFITAATGLIIAGTAAGGTTQPALSVSMGFTVEAERLIMRLPGMLTVSP